MNKYCGFSEQVCQTFGRINEAEQVFSAYSSHDEDILKQINDALEQLNKNSNIKWVSWEKDMEIEDSIIFCEICKHINRSKAILVELSDLNFNVLFEYGYSMGLSKKIHPIVNQTFDYNNVERFVRPLVGIGIGKYKKNKLHEKLLKKKFWEKGRENFFYDFDENQILSDDTKIDANSVLYLKNIDSPTVTENIERQMQSFNFQVIVDDSHEESNNLAWYSKQIKRSYAVIIDLGLSSTTDNFKHFLKCAFIAGICVATGRRVLILNSVHAQKPSDIISITKEYESPRSAGNKVFNFLNDHSSNLSIITSYINTKHRNQSTIFDDIDLGEHVAINDKYFIDKGLRKI